MAAPTFSKKKHPLQNANQSGGLSLADGESGGDYLILSSPVTASKSDRWMIGWGIECVFNRAKPVWKSLKTEISLVEIWWRRYAENIHNEKKRQCNVWKIGGLNGRMAAYCMWTAPKERVTSGRRRRMWIWKPFSAELRCKMRIYWRDLRVSLSGFLERIMWRNRKFSEF